MIIRKLKPKENVQKLLIESICFLDQEPEDRYEWLRDPMKHTKNYNISWGGFGDDGILYSCMQVLPFTMQFNNQKIKMGGIAGVVTLPEARSKGFIRKIFKEAFVEMKEKNQIFSFVYPFSYNFYRKLGYEHAYIRYLAEIEMNQLADYPYPNGIKSYRKGNECIDFKIVYDAFIVDKNLAILRDEDDWKNLLNRDPHLERNFTYLHYDENGEADAYILYKPDEEEALLIQEMAWSKTAGLHAMLGFLYGLRTEYNKVKWEVPNCLDVFTLFPESWEVSISWTTAGMNRIVDLQAVLKLLEVPIGFDKVIIDVIDSFLPWNTGRYQVAWENGMISVTHTDAPADMETNIETLTQMVTGYISPSEALHKKGITIRSNIEKLTALFPKKYLYMMEHF